MTFFCSGTAEGFKGGIHASLALLAGCCVAYNATAYCYRRERHLSVNTVVYVAVTVYEVVKVVHHLHCPVHDDQTMSLSPGPGPAF